MEYSAIYEIRSDVPGYEAIALAEIDKMVREFARNYPDMLMVRTQMPQERVPVEKDYAPGEDVIDTVRFGEMVVFRDL